MASRRRHFGSVRKLPSGRYQASYFHEAIRHIAPHTFATKGEAYASLAALEADVNRGLWINPTSGQITLAEWSNQWLNGRSDLRPVTRAKYRHMLDRHVLPVLGSQELSKLRPPTIRAWYMEMRKNYVTTADDAYRMLRAIFTTAVVDEVIARIRATSRAQANLDRLSDRWRPLPKLKRPWPRYPSVSASHFFCRLGANFAAARYSACSVGI